MIQIETTSPADAMRQGPPSIPGEDRTHGLSPGIRADGVHDDGHVKASIPGGIRDAGTRWPSPDW